MEYCNWQFEVTILSGVICNEWTGYCIGVGLDILWAENVVSLNLWPWVSHHTWVSYYVYWWSVDDAAFTYSLYAVDERRDVPIFSKRGRRKSPPPPDSRVAHHKAWRNIPSKVKTSQHFSAAMNVDIFRLNVDSEHVLLLEQRHPVRYFKNLANFSKRKGAWKSIGIELDICGKWFNILWLLL